MSNTITKAKMNSDATSLRFLLTLEEAAEFLNVPANTLRYWRKVGQGPAWVKMEGTIRYNRTDLEDYVRSCTHQPAVRAAVEAERVRI